MMPYALMRSIPAKAFTTPATVAALDASADLLCVCDTMASADCDPADKRIILQ